MLVFKQAFRRSPGYLQDDAGSAHIEWVIAVALVVVTAVPVMTLIGKGSEKRSGEIAISIQETESQAKPDGSGLAGGSKIAAVRKVENARTDVPGADLGIGYDDESDFASGSYALMGNAPGRLQSPSLNGLRRDKPAEPNRRPGNSLRSASANGVSAPEGSQINLPRMPSLRVGFGDTTCVVPIDGDTIVEARYDPAEVVESGR